MCYALCKNCATQLARTWHTPGTDVSFLGIFNRIWLFFLVYRVPYRYVLVTFKF